MTAKKVIKKIERQIDWRGSNNTVLDCICLSREDMLILLTWIYEREE